METRNFQAGASASPPTAPVSPSVGYATNGNPSTATPATQPGEFWFHKIGEELRAILTDRGVTPSDSTLSQLSSALMNGVVGESRNVAMTVSAASATATLTADEIVVKSALGLGSKVLASFSKSINLAITGAGGMDTGTAPISGFVALYAIYNPATATSALLAVNATAAAAPEVYGGANMPSGYTMSALVSVWPTNASSQFVVGQQTGRNIGIQDRNAFNWGAVVGSYTPVALTGITPLNAKSISGSLSTTINASGAGGSIVLDIATDANAVWHKTSITDIQTAGAPYNTEGFSINIKNNQIYAKLIQTGTGVSALSGSMVISGYSI